MISSLIILSSYLFGSFPSAYLAGYLLRGIDIRKVGDRNAGTANVYRNVSHKAGIVVAIVDIGKGAVPILVAKSMVSEHVVLLCGLATVIGHNWPIFLGLKGGRGAATTLGVLFALMPVPMTLVLTLSAVSFFITHNIILTCATIFAPLPLIAWLMGASWTLIGYSVGLSCLVGLTHFITTRHLPEEAKHEATFMQ